MKKSTFLQLFYPCCGLVIKSRLFYNFLTISKLVWKNRLICHFLFHVFKCFKTGMKKSTFYDFLQVWLFQNWYGKIDLFTTFCSMLQSWNKKIDFFATFCSKFLTGSKLFLPLFVPKFLIESKLE